MLSTGGPLPLFGARALGGAAGVPEEHRGEAEDPQRGGALHQGVAGRIGLLPAFLPPERRTVGQTSGQTKGRKRATQVPSYCVTIRMNIV